MHMMFLLLKPNFDNLELKSLFQVLYSLKSKAGSVLKCNLSSVISHFIIPHCRISRPEVFFHRTPLVAASGIAFYLCAND